ncbi:hypothetical protein LNP74_28515 [Klebsiella pneumoniae subsp. pneumoniae]|nr:hypothetical protein [Klebsiella pneumoniae subsp. pneumoniae]
MEAIGHVVRCFENDNIIHVAGKVNPAEDTTLSTPNWRCLTLIPANARIRTARLKKPKAAIKTRRLSWPRWKNACRSWKTPVCVRALDLTKEEKEAIRYLELPDPEADHVHRERQ